METFTPPRVLIETTLANGALEYIPVRNYNPRLLPKEDKKDDDAEDETEIPHTLKIIRRKLANIPDF